MPHNKADVAADLLAGCKATHNPFVTVQRAAVELTLGSVPAALLLSESTPTSEFVIVRRKELIAALETTEADEPTELEP